MTRMRPRGGLNPDVINAVARVPSVGKVARQKAAEVRKLARKKAPKDTKAGAKSIQVKRVVNKKTGRPEYRVSWDRDHFYMASQESGAKLKNGGRIKAKHFLRDAADEINGTGATP